MLELSLRNAVAWAIQVAALGGVGVALPMAFRIGSPRVKLVYLRALLIACLVLPLAQPWVPSPLVSGVAGEPAALLEPGVALSPAPALPSPPPRGWPFRDWLGLLPWSVEAMVIVILLGGVAARLAWLGLGLVSLSRLRRLSAPLEPRPEAVNEAMRLVGADAEFRVSSNVVRPVTFGLRRPLVLLPRAFTTFDPAQQTAVAAHELIHVDRRDWVRTLGDELLLSVLWFHPALWWLVGQIHLSMEQIVDHEVIRLTGSRRPYLEALLKLAAAGPTPMMQPAAPFLKHGHLAQRVALLVREASMSRIRLVASFLIVLGVLACSGWVVVGAFPLRSPAAPLPNPATGILPGAIEEAGHASGAILPATMTSVDVSGQGSGQATGWQTRPTIDPKAQQARPGMPPPPPPPPPPGMKTPPPGPFDLARWEQGLTMAQQQLAVASADPMGHYTLGALYWERAYRDKSLSEVDERRYVTMGLDAMDQALLLRPKYMEALVYKNLLLRQQATLERDPGKQQALLAQAEVLRSEAMQLRSAQTSWGEIPPNAARVGGTIKAPAKIKDVRPVYPPVAQSARVQGVVIVEILVGEDGHVQAGRVLRSIPLLDQAALDAVRQWEFAPTLLNGSAVPVVMTVTVNFVLSDKTGGGVVGGVVGGTGGGVTGGIAGGVVGGVVGGVPGAPPPPPPPPEPLPPDTGRVGSGIRPPAKTLDVRPVYPLEAQQAKIQGTVIIEVVIGKDGKVMKARVLRSIPLLDQAAMDAVLQWEFTPTEVGGVAMNVVMTVTVNFTLK